MKDISISIKEGESYKSLINIKQGKFGPQLAFSPDFQRLLFNWLKAQDGKWLNMNVKEFEPKPSQHEAAKANNYQPDDSAPF